MCDETSQCNVDLKCTLLQTILLNDQDRFIELAQDIRKSIQINSDSNENDLTTGQSAVINKGICSYIIASVSLTLIVACRLPIAIANYMLACIIMIMNTLFRFYECFARANP